MNRERRMRSLENLLGDYLRHFRHDAEKTELFLSELWPQVVGPQLAKRTRPLRLQQGRLRIGVAASRWKTELEPLSESFQGAVNRFWGCPLVRGVDFIVRTELEFPDDEESGA